MITNFIVITGASKGIGRAAADALVEQGWSVIGIARSSSPQATIIGRPSNENLTIKQF